MKIVIFYFSGTGNTELVTRHLAEALEGKGNNVELFRIENTETTDICKKMADCDLTGIGYPIYGGGTPAIISDFIMKLPDVASGRLFIFKTAADFTAFNHKASWRLIKKLEKKGYDVFYDRIIAMGSNWFIEYDDGFVKQLYKAATEKTVHMADELIAGTRRRYRFSGFAAAMVTILSFCEEKIGARIFGITLHADKTCTKCGLCAKKCPVSNIKMNEKPAFGSNCLMCMRCVYNCPVNAVKSRGMGFCVLSGGYNIRRIIKDSSLDDKFVNDKTSGYFKHFYQYLVDRSM